MGRYRTEDTAYVSNRYGRYKLAFYPYATDPLSLWEPDDQLTGPVVMVPGV